MTAKERSEKFEQRLIDFAIRIVRLSNQLPKDFAGAYFGKQVLRSGSSPALNYAEARSAESDKDFRHKCSIALKEMRETYVNLRIIEGAGLFETERLASLIRENHELIAILVSTVKTMDQKIKGG